MKNKDDAAYRQMFMGNPVPMMILDTETLGFLAVNDAAVDQYGYSREEFLALTALEIRPPEEIKAAAKRIHDRKSGLDRVGVWQHRKKDGTVIAVEITGHDTEFARRPARLVMCSDVTENLMAQERLRESEERFRTTFHLSPDIMTISRVSDGVYVDINDAFLRISGFNRDEVVGMSSLDLEIWADPENRKELVDLLQKTGILENMEIQFCRKDGTTLPGLISCQVVTFENEPHILTIVKDITERKVMEEQIIRSLEEKEMLLKEIHHRVKNNLQAVAGLLNLQAEMIRDEDTLKSFKENEARILSMALIHEKLYQVEDSSRINMGDYVMTLMDRLVHFHSTSPSKVKVRVRAAKVTLNLDTIVPVGLILHELVSNALKYAFPGSREGAIRVSLSKRKDGTLSLKVADDGIGLPEDVDVGKSKSLGMMLVKSFADGLSGTVKVNRKEGTAFTITFKEYLEHGIEYTT
jgi:PAS domain S-box-containing protein